MTKQGWRLLEYLDAQLIDRAAEDIGHDRLRLAPIGKAKKARSRTPRKEYWRQR